MQPRELRGRPSGGQWVTTPHGEADLSLGPTTASWPAIGWEQHPWEVEPQPGESRRARLASRGPYEAAVVPRVAELDPTRGISSDLLAEAEAATVEMVRFDAEMGLGAAPFASVLLRSESSSSSEIEQLTVGARKLALAELGDRSSPNAVLVAHNVAALRSAIDLSEDLSTAAIEEMHWALLGGSEPDRAGKFRTQQVWIGGRSPHTAMFVPPHHEQVPDAMADLVEFMRRDNIPALAQAAIAHAQFETIHPFTDGNGRTGRAIVSAILRSKDITPNAAVPVSSGLLRDTRGYFQDLGAYREGEVEPIVARFAEAALHAVDTGRELVSDLRAAQAEHAEALAAAPKSARDAAGLLVRSPAITADLLQTELGMSQPTAYRTLERLQEAEVIRPAGHISGARVWISPAVVDALDAFAARAGRRTRAQ